MIGALDSCLETHLSLEDIPTPEINFTHIIIYGYLGCLEDIQYKTLFR